jgi:hypothetical protein
MCNIAWDSVWNFLQGAGAMASVVIAWHVYKQGNRIRTLTDVVQRMDKQNILLEERLKIEKYARMAEIVPVFVWWEKTQNAPHSARITIRNMGADAKSIYTTDDISKDLYKVELHDHHASKGGLVGITISSKDGKPLENIDFFVVSTGISGMTSKQKIFKYPEHDLNIGFPDF